MITTRVTTVSGMNFKTEGKVLVEPGWLSDYGKSNSEDKELIAVAKDEKVNTESINVVALQTKPPARYSEATLLSAMEGAGKLVEEDEFREAMAEKGLGTPATSLGIEELTQPALTGGWEFQLSQMEKGLIKRESFMQEIAQMTQRIVKRAKEFDSDTIPGDYITLKTPCPHCGGPVKENYRRFACEKCGFSISKIPGGKALEYVEAEELLENKQIGPLQGFRSKMGRPFSAIIKLSPIPLDDKDYPNAGFKLEFDFGNSDEDNLEIVDFTGKTALGPCPKCSGAVYEHGMKYICENSVGPNRNCDFNTGKVILQQEIAEEQIQKLLANGKTDLLPNFKSQRTGRIFKAYLVRQETGKIGFEFEARVAKKRDGDTEDAPVKKPTRKRTSPAKKAST